ncbi:MAG: malto-oligosyltrehalose synthase [Candidatus Aureabacteria bacterium]|nr:malto-oligosyltrehalose synthase [Candidatus Auribacterota bacterium]
MNIAAPNLENKPSDDAPKKKTFSEEKLRAFILKKIRTIFIPSSVYRLQLNREFTLKKASVLLSYLKKLGIHAVYCSPFFQAAPGSMHGYNVTDPNQINKELGSWEDYLHFCDKLSQSSMGQIADIVPNHMGITGNNNPWWQDVLENGQSSLYADYFDVNWNPVKQELAHKVLIPVLGDFYGKVLENQELFLHYQKGGFYLSYYDHQFPVDPKTYPDILDDPDNYLVKNMGDKNPDLIELLSIITAFKNLPSSHEILQEKKMERSREKEIAKQRLDQLVGRCEDIRVFIDGRLLIYNGNKNDLKSFDAMDQLLNQQPYRLAYWSVAFQEINYRRFFDINDLAALRIEDEKVFLHHHELLFRLIQEGKINGLRIDHPDGLYDPSLYFKRLQREYLLQMLMKEFEEQLRPEGDSSSAREEIDKDSVRQVLDGLFTNEFLSSPPFYIVAEKILDRNETMPGNWSIHGTVGYDYMNALNGLFVKRCNEKRFADLYENFIGHAIDYEGLVYDKKNYFCQLYMASEINELGHRLDFISETNRNYRDFTRNDLTTAIREVIAGFPVYRTYVSSDGLKISERDEKNIHAAIARARNRTPALHSAVYDFLENALLLRLNIEPGSEEMKLYKDFLLRFQQLSGPIMAKGLEDTSFYVYNRLISLNEVGGDPFYFGYTVPDFHEHNLSRNRRWPCSMLSSSTHDTKRSEDVRMRINVLSEIPDEWEQKIKEWADINQKYKTFINEVAEPRRNTEYFIYQTLVGIWPDNPVGSETGRLFIRRIWQYVLKSIREAKIYTNWLKPNEEYEKAVESFVASILSEGEENGFLKSFAAFQERVSFLGKLNSLSATLIKMASPGVVDIYQGNETWNYCLVDPDNRKPVDYKGRKDLLSGIRKKDDENRVDQMSFGAVTPDNMKHLKFYYTMKGLLFRRKHKDLFVGGEYIPVDVKGPKRENIIAFIRKYGKDLVLLAALRFFSELLPDESDIINSQILSGTELIWPKNIESKHGLRDIIRENIITTESKGEDTVIRASDLFQSTCVCMLTADVEE